MRILLLGVFLLSAPALATELIPELQRLPLQPGVWTLSDARADADAGVPAPSGEVLVRALPGGRGLALESADAFELLSFDLATRRYRLERHLAAGISTLDGTFSNGALVFTGHEGKSTVRRTFSVDGSALTQREEVAPGMKRLQLKAVTKWERNPSAPPTPGHVTGVGGIFFKSADGKALRQWYHDRLGLPLGEGGSWVDLRWRDADDPSRLAHTIWAVFKKESKHFDGAFMINYRVDDLAALLKQLEAADIRPERTEDEPGNGRFAWIRDPDGNLVELWEPPPNG